MRANVHLARACDICRNNFIQNTEAKLTRRMVSGKKTTLSAFCIRVQIRHKMCVVELISKHGTLAVDFLLLFFFLCFWFLTYNYPHKHKV